MRKPAGLWPYLVLNTLTIINLMALVALLADLRAERGFDERQLGLIVGVGYLSTMAIQLSIGRYADVGWAKQMVLFSTCLVGLSSLLMMLADSLWLSCLSRMLLGLGGGMMGPALRRAAVLHDPQRVSRNLSLITLTDLLGFVVGPLIAAALNSQFGLGAPFLAVGVAMFVVWPLGLLLPTETRDQKRTTPPSMGLDLFGRRVVVGALIMATLQFLLTGGLEAVWAVQLEDAGLGRESIGLGFLALAIPLGLGAAVGGVWGDRMTDAAVALRWVVSAQLAAALCVGLMAFAQASLLALFVCASFGAVMGGLAMPLSMTAFSRQIPGNRQAAAMGILGTCEVGFGALGAFGCSWLYDQSGPRVMWLAASIAVASMAILGRSLGRETTQAVVT